MKKLLPLLLSTSLLLSACSINWNDEKDKTIETEKQTQENLFKKKQECEKYTDEANKYYKNNDGGVSIFYSEVLNTCIVSYIGIPEINGAYDPEDPVNPSSKKYIIDYLTKEIILQTEDGVLWNNKIKELKGEKIIDVDKEYENYLKVINKS